MYQAFVNADYFKRTLTFFQIAETNKELFDLEQG